MDVTPTGARGRSVAAAVRDHPCGAVGQGAAVAGNSGRVLRAGFKASSGSCSAGDLSALWSGLKFGLGYGAILGLVFGLILGGLAWLRHYLLRLLLYLDRRQTPWRFERFLAYAAQLRLLRQVGGGFEFIDQELQAYFEKLGSRYATSDDGIA